MTSRGESMNPADDENEESIKDEEARRNIQVLSARLYDLKERFMKIVHKINHDAIGYTDQLSDEDDTTNDEESDDEATADEKENHSAETTNDDDEDEDENETRKSQISSKVSEKLIESILERKARRYEYIKYIVQYPKIMEYILNDNTDYVNIPLRDLKSFIKEHVDKNPNGQVYDKINNQIQNIRRNYLQDRQ